jgi:FkbM family methyltransferase
MSALIQRCASQLAGAIGHESLFIRSVRPAYEQILWWSSLGRGIPWTINGIACRIDPRERHRMARQYDEPAARWLARRIAPGDSCLNVGANTGVYVIQLAHWSGPGGRVVAFEPNPAARQTLVRHVRMNRLDGRVEIVPSAVSDREGASTFFASDAGDGMSRLSVPNERLAGATPMTVTTTTLDVACAVAPTWVVIDVEGFEIQVLRGARRVLRQCAGVVVELHPDAWAAAGTTRDDLEKVITELSLSVTPLSGQSDPFGAYGLVALQSSIAGRPVMPTSNT